jgi:3-hydroxybutyrate dehydrogenase
MTQHLKLHNQTALITGAARGIGAGIAKRFVTEGANVVIADINLSEATATADTLNAIGIGQAIGVEMDVTDEISVNNAVALAAEKWGGIDILISNAGIQIVHPLEDFPFADWKKMLSIHLDGAFLTTKACLPYMYKQKRGSLIYMGSVHSKEASPLKSAYVTAKHGLMGLSKVMAKEGAKYGVRSNVICPGFVETELVRKQIPEQAKTFGISEQDVIEKIMLVNTVDKEFTTIDDVANVALFLAGFETNALTGQSIVVSHGWCMN